MMKQKLLIINKLPFGTLTDAYKWCEYLRTDYDITFICFNPDSGSAKIQLEGVNVKYVSASRSYLLRGIKFIFISLFNALFFNGKIMIVYFDHCEIIKKMLPWKKMLLDVRTLAVWGNQKERDKHDDLIRKTCERFDEVTLISQGIADRLQLRNKRVHILPLGADVISQAHKDYSSIHLLYVGTLYNRNIETTIEGFAQFCEKYPQSKITYDIIGAGRHGEELVMTEIVKKYNLEEKIHFWGRKPYSELKNYFDKANVGVSFVPITPAYNVQPVTKTFEYANSGLFVIGTATMENKKVITSENGILIQDSPEAFADALKYIEENKAGFKESDIRESLKKYAWRNIIYTHLVPVLNQL